MRSGIIDVLTLRRFWPLFVSQFLGAANDNLFKNAMAILLIYRLGQEAALSPEVLVSLASAVFILPFFLLSATAGLIADRFEKSGLIRLVKLAEVFVAGLALWSVLYSSIPGMFAALFLFGVQATFFGPLKYAVLPEQLAEQELVAGNALIEGGTFLAILLGTIAGGLLILRDFGQAVSGGLILTLALLGFCASCFLPKARPGNPLVRPGFNVLKETAQVVSLAKANREVYLAILGISWFWLVGITYLTQFPGFAKEVLHSGEHAVTLMLTLFSVGIGLGSLLSAKLQKGELSTRHLPLASLLMSLCALDFWLAGLGLAAAREGLPEADLRILLELPVFWRALLDLLLLSVAGGVFTVPLYTILQARSEEESRARVVAANNVLNAAFMAAGSLAGALLLAAGLNINAIFLLLGLGMFAVSLYIALLLPEDLLKPALAGLLRLMFRVEVKGLEHLEEVGEKAVLAVNHVSFLDALLVAAFLPRKPTFAINTFIAKRWWVRPFLFLVEAYPLDPTNALSTRGLIHCLQEGRTCVIFPEGRITVSGGLMKVYPGSAMIADKAEAPILPVRLEGAQYSLFSRLGGKLRRRLFPKITLTVMPPRRLELSPELKGRARRARAGEQLYDMMSQAMFENANPGQSLFAALLKARKTQGGGAVALEDVNRKPLSYSGLIGGALLLGRKLGLAAEPGRALGLLLPNANASAAVFFAAQAYARVPAMLNYTSGAQNLLAACQSANIDTVVTSRRFVEQGRLTGLIQSIEGKLKLIYLEDVRESLNISDKLYALFCRPFAAKIAARFERSPDDLAVLLFTSGSEGAPKGVALSSANILSNCKQAAARIDFTPADTLFNALPIFHSFGLTAGLLLPLFAGLRTFLYPSPLHYRIVPELIYDANASIVFGADTFLSGYARVASPTDFRSVRYIFAGAEKLREETRRVYADKFGLRLLEGYGATETAPILSLNTPLCSKPGSVGRLLPGIEHRLETVEGVEGAGRLWVKGPNVMLGYLNPEKPGSVRPLAHGWYDTGDIVRIDESGYLFIEDRAKRFAKLAGEMVPLSRVENEISLLWPGKPHAVIALADGRKGERLVLLSEDRRLNRAELIAGFKARDLPELMLPKTVIVVDKMPLLATGKIDYVKTKALAEERLAQTLNP